jgi:alanyl-tRNA synthetase
MTAKDIRTKYLEFMRSKGHAIIPRANLVPQDDPTTLFTNSGMQPMVPYLLGADHPLGTRLADSQPVLRAEDIDEVGDNSHTTFFEMLGNWSLGDYFKREQLPFFWEFLTGELKLDPQRIYVTAFIGDDSIGIPKDTESGKIWQGLYKELGIDATEANMGSQADGGKRGIKPGERIFYYDAKENWWSRAGVPANMPAGEPGGPDSEVFYEFTDVEHDRSFGAHCHPACDCSRFIEIGNSVFMAYRKQDDGSFEELPKKNVDFGGGVERLAAAVQDQSDMFRIDLLWPLIKEVERLSGKIYQDEQMAMRIVADHVRVALWLGVDGVRPSNVVQGYVMRRFIRRAIRQGLRLGIREGLCEAVATKVADLYRDSYPEVKEQEAEVLEVLQKEEELFRRTLERGVKEFGKIVSRKQAEPVSAVGSVDPLNPEVGHLHREFDRKAKAANTIYGPDIFTLFDTYGFPPELSIEEAEQLGLHIDQQWHDDYDRLMTEQKERSRTATAGVFKGGLVDQSDATVRLHTATHLMYQALRQVLGDHVVQRGSNITPERTRFDFSHDAKLTDEQKHEVERIVNEQIGKDLKVWFEEHSTKEAFKLGAKGAFGDKYGDTVKVYFMAAEGEKPFSVEICGGPHVEHTGELGHFRIQKEESSSAGVRRIKAVLE